MPFIENLDEFAKRQTGEPILHPTTDHYLWPNGAASDGIHHAEAPTDEITLIERQLVYWRLALRNVEAKHQQCAAYIKSSAQFHASGVGPGPGDDSFDHLERFAKLVEHARAQLGTLGLRLEQLRPTDRIKVAELEQARRERQDDATRWLTRIAEHAI